MGESRQVGDDKTADGQEQNRRVVVRGVLQNEGIADALECAGSHRMSPKVPVGEDCIETGTRYGNSNSHSRLHLSLLFAPACAGKEGLDRHEKWGSFHG